MSGKCWQEMREGGSEMQETNPTKKLSRRHHYPPQMYLRGFADEADLVWFFDRQNNSHLHQGVLNTAAIKDFYIIHSQTCPISFDQAERPGGGLYRIERSLRHRGLMGDGSDL
jgi:hypothetical protein